MQVDLKDLIIALSNDSRDIDFRAALDEAKKAQASAQTDYVTLFVQKYEERSEKSLSRLFVVNEKLKEDVNIESTNQQVQEAIRKIASETVESTYNLLKQRIDRFGVAQPVVSLDKSTDRITVELPGVRNPKRARNYLQATANLEFWELYENMDVLNQINTLNEDMKAREKANADTLDTSESLLDEEPDTSLIDITADSNEVIDLLGDSSSTDDNSLAADSTDFGPLFSILQPNFPRTTADKSATIGFAESTNINEIMSILNSDEAKKLLPRGVKFVWKAKSFKGTDGKKYFELFALNTKGRKVSKLNGERVVQSFPTPNPSGPGFAVSLSMDQEGARV
jgi:SecD/SecF fusion protein